MNSRPLSTALPSRRTSRWRNGLLGIAAALFMAPAAKAQVSYSESFDVNTASWTGMTHFTGSSACGGSGGSIRANLYSGVTSNNLVSPELGTSIGGLVTISYMYKAANWSSNTVGASGWGSFNVQYGASATGPWTTVATVTNEAQTGSCLSKSHTFLSTAGPLYIRFNTTWQSGDYYLNFDNVELSEVEALPCAGAPAPGNTTGPSTVASGAPLTLGLQNETPGTGVSYQWYVSTTSAVAGFTAVGTNSSTLITTQTALSWYYADVTCDGNTTASTVLEVDLGYCVPTYQYSGDYISNFSTTQGITNITNASGGASPANYGDFTALTVTAPASTSFDFSISYVGGTNGVRIWVDWNNNKEFETNESVFFLSSGDATKTGTISIPPSTPIGNYRMRVRAQYGSGADPTPCGQLSFGETEDYTLTVVPPPTCLAPFSLSAGNITTNSAEISFTCVTCGGNYIVEYGVGSFTPGTGATAGVGGTVVTGTSSPINLTGLSAASGYTVYVREDCGGGDFSANSSVLSFSTACGIVTIPYAQNFNAVTTPALPNCWSVVDVNGNTTWRTMAYSSNGFSGNVAYYGWNADLPGNDWLFTPPLELTGGQSYRVSYKYASANTIYYEAMDVWYGSDATPGAMTELIVDHGEFNFTAASVVHYDLIPDVTGTYHIGWHAKSGADEFNLYLDDIEVTLSPTCFAPSDLAISSLTPTTADVSWTPVGSAVDYLWEIRTSGLPGTPTGLVASGNGAAALANITGLTANTNYMFYVRTDCDEPELSGWSNGLPLFTGYCAASSTDAFDGTITNLTLGSVINNSSTALVGYEDLTSVVGNVVPGMSYDLSITTSPSYLEDQVLVWIDLNGNMVFEPSELVLSAINPAPYTATVTIPSNQAPGTYRMRARHHYAGAGYGNATPCGTSEWGQVEDYTISVCSAPTASAAITTEDCGAQTFTVNYAITDIGSGATALLEYSFDGVAQTPIAYNNADIEIVGIPVGTTVTATLTNNEGCYYTFDALYSTCDIELDCSAPAVLQSHCYETGDTRTWTYVNDDPTGTVALSFLSGSMQSTDQFQFWEGAVGAAPATPASLTGNLTGGGITSTGNVLSMSILTDGSGSCADGAFGGIVWQVRCGGCTEPAGFVTIDENDLGFNPVVCIAQGVGTFNPWVGIEDTGIDANTGAAPATVGYRVTVNGVPQADVTGLPGGDYYDLGTFALGDLLNVTLLHEDQAGQSACNNLLVTNFTIPVSACGPVNDVCATAIPLSIGSFGSCPAGAIEASTIGATQDGPSPTCAAPGAVQDIWFTLNTTDYSGYPYIKTTDITATVVGLEVYTACGTPYGACVADVTAPDSLQFNLPPAEYLLRFFTSAAGAGSFNVCLVGPPLAGTECDNATAITSFPVENQSMVCTSAPLPGLLSSTNVTSACGGFTTSYMGGQEGLYSFVAPTTDSYLISYTGSTWSGIAVYADACPTNNGVCVGGVSSTTGSKSLTVDLTEGTTYYIWFDTWPTPNSPCPGTFSINYVPPPPANDECADAVNLTVNPDLGCGIVTAGTIAYATGSSDANSCDGTDDDDVWYTFTATSTAHRVSLTNITGSTTDLYMAITSGSCGSMVDVLCSDPETANLTGLSIGTVYTIRVYSYTSTAGQTSSFNICVGTPPPPPANDNCGGAYALTVNPDYNCAAVTAGTLQSATASPESQTACSGTENDDVWFTFVATATTHRIELLNVSGSTDMYHSLWTGGCGSLTLVSGTCSDPNTSNPTGLTIGNTYYLRVYSYGTSVQSTTFNVCVGTAPPPPANDNCGGAYALTVNPDYSCAAVTAGTLQSATASPESQTACGGTENDDVWFTFVATATTHRIDLTDVSGSTTDLYHSLWTGGCGSLTLVPGTCSDDNTSNPSGLTIGNTYFLRVYSWSSSAGATTSFNVCIGTPPPPPANDNCGGAYALTVNPDYSCAAVTAGTLQSATASPESQTACSGTENDDVWFTFVATATTHRIELLNVSGSTTDLFHSLWTGGCGSLTLVPGTCSDPETSTPTGLTIGNTYYLRVYSYGSSLQSTTFNVCVGTAPPIPANDNCGGAFSLTVNPDFGCGAVTAGSIASATASPESATACSGTENDDVWFTFVATSTTHRISLLNVTGSTTDLYHSLWTGGCGTLSLVSGSCSDPNQSDPTGLTVGQTYYLRVYSYGSTAQTTGFNVCVGTTPPPPPNDLCVNAIPVACNSITAGYTASGTTTGAPTGTCGTSLNTAAGVWYTVQGWGGPITASLCGATYDSKIGIFTGSCGAFTCVAGNDDFCSTQSQVTWASTAGTTYYIYVTGFSTNTGNFNLEVTCSELTASCTANGLTIDFQTDNFPGQTTWEVRAQNGAVMVVGAGPLVAPNGTQSQSLCLPNGCYTLLVYDSAGDGIANGGYVLRRAGASAADNRIIDNTRNFNDGSLSAVSGGANAFCLPMSEQKPIFVARDKMDWVSNEYFVCEPDQAVSDVWLNTTVGAPERANTGYQFWFFDPNGDFSYRRGRYHSTSDGFGPADQYRACHMRINNWDVANQIPANRMMNVRVRTRVNGVYGEFGPAYRFMIDPVAAACPLTKLNDIPDQQYMSCNSTRNWGNGNFLHARQKAGANKYQFRFRIAAENFVVVRSSNTYFLPLNWTSSPLQPGKTYDVDVRVSKDGGATWCTSGPSWGESCTVTITSQADDNNQNIGMVNTSGEGLSMWPNPNAGDQLYLDLQGIEADVEAVAVDIYDMTGKQIVARMIPTQGDRLNTVLNLQGDLATGMYLVNITAGNKRYTERLVIAN